MKNVIRRFARDRSGATALTYGLIAALVSVAAIPAVSVLGSNTSGLFGSASKSVASLDLGSGSSSSAATGSSSKSSGSSAGKKSKKSKKSKRSKNSKKSKKSKSAKKSKQSKKSKRAGKKGKRGSGAKRGGKS